MLRIVEGRRVLKQVMLRVAPFLALRQVTLLGLSLIHGAERGLRERRLVLRLVSLPNFEFLRGLQVVFKEIVYLEHLAC